MRERKPTVRTLSWAEIANHATWMFSIRAVESETRWAESAWQALTSRGLTAYDNLLGRYRGLIRLMVLATLYHEFSHLAWGEEARPEYGSWAYDLGLQDFRLGQLAGPDLAVGDETNDEILVEEALAAMVEEERMAVVAALTEEAGGRLGLFASMWMTGETDVREEEGRHGEEGQDGEADLFHLDQSILDRLRSEATPDMMPAFEWVTDGLPSVWR